ncbi:MAG: DUF4367 domain-containing protein [Clostridiales Family XIII bacterium]|jgi:hypothetical protein|nr:DUF4367 domain-containing protein [Clostridiales Family XIII bacterium]
MRDSEARAEEILRIAVLENQRREMNTVFPGEENLRFSDRHEKRMKTLFAKARRRDAMAAARVFARRVAWACALIFTVLSASLLTDAGVRAAAGRTVLTWFDNFASFTFDARGKEETTETEWSLARVPEGLTQTHRDFSFGCTTLNYSDADGEVVLWFSAYPSETAEINVDTEHSAYRTETRDGIEYEVFAAVSGEYPSSVVWRRGGYAFHLAGYLKPGELVGVAASASGG